MSPSFKERGFVRQFVMLESSEIQYDGPGIVFAFASRKSKPYHHVILSVPHARSSAQKKSRSQIDKMRSVQLHTFHKHLPAESDCQSMTLFMG